MPQAIDYDALAAEHGGSAVQPVAAGGIDYDALAAAHGGRAVDTQTPLATTEQGAGDGEADPNTIGTFASHAVDQVNPVGLGQMLPFPKSLGGAGWDAPLQALKNIGAAHEAVAHGAKEAYDKGDYLTAGRKAVDYLLPVIGPVLDKSADRMAQGKYAAGLGDAVGLALAMFGGKPIGDIAAAGKVAVLPAVAENANAAERAAVAFGQDHGIPVDAATATGNRYVRSTQALTEHTPIGGIVAERAKVVTADAMARVSGDLADAAHPAAVTPEQAGTGIRQAEITRLQGQHAEASQHYDTLRAIEADPARTASMQVDIAPAKKTLGPIYDSLKREAELVPLQGGRGRALVALDRLMTGPDMAPLSVVDGALGDLKAMARGADIPELRSQGQGVAAEAVKQLDAQVRATAASAGPDAATALQKGRAATVAKYDTADVLDTIRDEPVQAYRQAVAPKDSGIKHLREIQRTTPMEIPKIGRAYLDDLFSAAQAEGGFDRGAKLQAEWAKLGSETKQILFPKAGQTADLDHFFLLAKKLQEPANSSKTALVTSAGAHGALILTNPATGVPLTLASGAVAKLLHSRLGVRALTQGLSISLPEMSAVPPGLKMAAFGDVLKAAQGIGINLHALPAAAESEPTPVSRATPDRAIDTVLKNEGGYVASDGSSGAPVIYGINAKSYPAQFAEAKRLTDTKGQAAGTAYAADFYKQQYWDKYHVGDLPASAQTIVLDGLVNHRAAFGQRLLAAAQDGASPADLVGMRRTEYQRLADANPPKYQRSLKAWNDRLDRLPVASASPRPMAKAEAGRIDPSSVPAVTPDDESVSLAPVDQQTEPGNIDLYSQRPVKNPDGSISTVRSMSFSEDGREILVPKVVRGQVVSDDDAVAEYHRTGRHLGIFPDAESATRYAQQLHRDYAAGKYDKAPDADRKYSSTQVALPPEIGAKLTAIGRAIPDDHLAEDGRETDPHVTVKYGLHTNDADEIRKVLADQPPITVKMGRTSFFPNGESNSGDVLKADVDSPELHALNAKIAAALKHTDTHPDYKPHATIAYLKPGMGKQYAGDDALAGSTATIDRLTFSAKDGSTVEIPLTGTGVPDDRPDRAAISDAIRTYKGMSRMDQNPGTLYMLARASIRGVTPEKQADALREAMRRIRAGAERDWPRGEDGRFVSTDGADE